MDVKPRRSVDGFARPAAPPTPPLQQITPPAQRLDFTAPPQKAPRRRWWRSLLFPFSILLCLSASFLVQSLPLGMAAIAVYAVVAWVRHLPSRYSFVMAFLALLTVVILLVVRQNVELAGNFATYTFLLLVVGIVSTTIESRIKPKRKRKI